MSRNGSSVYPATLDSFARIGTANYEDEAGYDIVNVENEAMDAVEKIQSVLGTTSGTNVFQGVSSGKFVATTDGWANSGETWTSLGGTAITPSVTTTSKYQKGDRVRYIQGGTTMYQYITSVSGTIFTTYGGTQYVTGTTAITSPFFSHESSPFGMPSYFRFTGSITGNAGTQPVLGNASQVSFISLNGSEAHLYVSVVFGTSSTYGTGEAVWGIIPPITPAVTQVLGARCWFFRGTTAYEHVVGAADVNSNAGWMYYYNGTAGVNYVNHLLPWTWSNTDSLSYDATYLI